MIKLLGYIASFNTMLSVYLTGNKHISIWYISIVNQCLWFLIGYLTQQYYLCFMAVKRYSQRAKTIEPLFSHLKGLFDIEKLVMKGLQNVQSFLSLCVWAYQTLIYYNFVYQRPLRRLKDLVCAVWIMHTPQVAHSIIKRQPSSWLQSHPATVKNQEIWKKCNFGRLCLQCNKSLPTKNRKQFIKNIVKYVFGTEACKCHP